jgi:hypothetical protein
MQSKEINQSQPEELLIVGNGVDFKNGYHGRDGSKSVDYEDYCFKSVVGELKSKDFAIGPHFIDSLFDVSSVMTKGVTRPDAIVFDVKNSDQWIIKRFYEFKSGKGNGIINKLDGFSKLLTHLREHKYFLPSLINEHLGETIRTPSGVIVPQDSDVAVTIIKQKMIKNGVFYVNVKFPIEYRRITYPK